jgi:hypothetical protein
MLNGIGSTNCQTAKEQAVEIHLTAEHVYERCERSLVKHSASLWYRKQWSNMRPTSGASLEAKEICFGDERGRQPRRPYFLSWPNSLPVFRLRKCNLRQAGHATPLYSSSGTSSSSSSQCWTFIDVAGHLNTKAAIGRPWRTQGRRGSRVCLGDPEPRQPEQRLSK